MCAVMKGKTPLKFTWLKDGKPLKQGAVINDLEKVSTLFIDPVVKQSSGNYTCISNNEFGRNSYSAFLSVKGKIAFFKLFWDLTETKKIIIIAVVKSMNFLIILSGIYNINKKYNLKMNNPCISFFRIFSFSYKLKIIY